MRLIDAEALKLDRIIARKRVFKDGKIKTINSTMDVYLRVEVDSVPTIDAEPVKHGNWERTEHNGFLRCSVCKDVYVADEWVGDGKWNYCPNCGAKMDGGNDE